jgi:hypothetical protein
MRELRTTLKEGDKSDQSYHVCLLVLPDFVSAALPAKLRYSGVAVICRTKQIARTLICRAGAFRRHQQAYLAQVEILCHHYLHQFHHW